MPITKPTLAELTAKLEPIALALGGTIQPYNQDEERCRLYHTVLLPSGMPLLFLADRTGLKYEISISGSIEKKNQIGWAKIAHVLPETAWYQSVFDYLDRTVRDASVGIGWAKPPETIAAEINRRLITPLAITSFDQAITAFVDSKELEHSFEREMRQFWDMFEHPPGTEMRIRDDRYIEIGGCTRVYYGWGVDLTGLSKAQLIEILRIAGRLKPDHSLEAVA